MSRDLIIGNSDRGLVDRITVIEGKTKTITVRLLLG